MNEQFIDINYENLAKLMEEFEKEIIDMQNTLQDIDDSTKDISHIWDGDDSEKTMSSFTVFKKEFDSVNEQNKKYLDYLETVIQTYKKHDVDTSSSIDSSSGAFGYH